MLDSTQLLRNTLFEWAALYGKKLENAEVEAWLRIFVKTKPCVLEKALDQVTRNADRKPTPGHLTKAIQEVLSTIPADGVTPYSYLKMVAKDFDTGQMVNAIVYDNEPGVVCYRATDCREGREFLNVLAKLQKRVEIPFPAPLEDEQQDQEVHRQKVAYEQYMRIKKIA